MIFFRILQSLENFLSKKHSLYKIIILIVLFNTLLYNLPLNTKYTHYQSNRGASGFSHHYAHKFFYFYYYKNYFPLATLNEDVEYSEEGAKNEIKKNGEELIMEYNHWSRLGEHARIFAYLPNGILSQSAENPSIKLFNYIIFVSTLIILFIGFYRADLKLYGLLLIILINITPFFIHEVYLNQNIFYLIPSVFLMILGFNIKYIYKDNSKIIWKIVLVYLSAILIGFFSEMRNEVSITLLSLFIIILFYKSTKLYLKILLILLSFITFKQTKDIIKNYFETKYKQTEILVKKHNGHIYNGKRIEGHRFWHPVFCGLGDFGEKYGYRWSDTIAYKYAVPILKEKYNLNIAYSGKYHTDNYYDKDSIYYIKFDEIAEYEQIMKEKVLSDIYKDPLWYLLILIKRIFVIFTYTLPIPIIGLIFFPLLYYFIKNKNLFEVKLLILSFPLSSTAFIIYSLRGFTYNNMFVYFTIISFILLIYKHKEDNFKDFIFGILKFNKMNLMKKKK